MQNVFKRLSDWVLYTGKVTIYNRVKAVKGTMFYLYHCKTPLIGWIKLVSEHTFQLITSCLSELYIIVDGRPTKDKVVWQALELLKDTNWLVVLTKLLRKQFFYGSPLSREVSLNHVLLLRESPRRLPNSLQYRWERFTHLYSWVDWSNESKVSCSRKQQQQQLMELGIEPGTLRSPGQCSNHSAVLPP